MNRHSNGPKRVAVMTSLLAGAVLVWVVGLQLQEPTSAQAAQSNFVGGTPSVADATAVRTQRLRFPAGARSNWHSHSWGQLLMVEEGRALTQARGGPVLEIGPGQPWFTKAGVEHWHGAAPDVDLLQLTIYEGTVKWLEPVTDKEYKATPKR